MTILTQPLIRAKEGFEKQYLFQSLKARQTYLMGMGKGSTNQLELSRETIRNLDIYVPSKKVLDQFEQVAQPMHDKISAISKSIMQLQTALYTAQQQTNIIGSLC